MIILYFWRNNIEISKKMIINFSKSDFFNKLFPEVDQADNEAVKNKLIDF
jgi:hypothetical protein